MSAAVRRRLQSWELQKRYGALRVRIASSFPACGETSNLDALLAMGNEARNLRQQIAFLGSQKPETAKPQDVFALPQSIEIDAQRGHARKGGAKC